VRHGPLPHIATRAKRFENRTRAQQAGVRATPGAVPRRVARRST
jgi:hypothetical protein